MSNQKKLGAHIFLACTSVFDSFKKRGLNICLLFKFSPHNLNCFKTSFNFAKKSIYLVQFFPWHCENPTRNYLKQNIKFNRNSTQLKRMKLNFHIKLEWLEKNTITIHSNFMSRGTIFSLRVLVFFFAIVIVTRYYKSLGYIACVFMWSS